MLHGGMKITGGFTREYGGVDKGGNDLPAFHVFTRRDGAVRHFGSGEMGDATSDLGQDPRGAPDPMPIWTAFDMTPERRGGNGYPKLDYPD